MIIMREKTERGKIINKIDDSVIIAQEEEQEPALQALKDLVFQYKYQSSSL